MANTKTFIFGVNFGGKADIKSAIFGVNFGRMGGTKTDIFGGKNWINCS